MAMVVNSPYMRVIGVCAVASLTLGSSLKAEGDGPYAGMAPPLLPQVTCADQRCSISFAAVFDGRTVITDPMPFDLDLAHDPTWQPVPIRDETLKINVELAPFGWTIGSAETATELFVTPLTEFGMEGEARVFMIEQRAGFDHLAVAYRFFAYNEAGGLRLVHEIGPNTGRQTMVTQASIRTVDTVTPVFDPETDDFVPFFESLTWVLGPDGLQLATPEELDAIDAATDHLGD
jgi:hypothetical protein